MSARRGFTVVEKVAEAHRADDGRRAGVSRAALRAGDYCALRPRHVMTHDNGAAVLTKFLALGARRVFDPAQPVFTLDHDIQNEAPENLAKYRRLEGFAREQGIAFHGAGEGIGHQLMVERGFVLPGALVVASDSHSNTYGALGAVGTPVVRTDAASIWATGEFWWRVPRAIEVVLDGALRPGATGKDVILALCAHHRGPEVRNAAVEFRGPGVATLSMDERLTIANMSTEWGALAAIFPADARTLAYLEERRAALAARGDHRLSGLDLRALVDAAPVADSDAAYAARIHLDLSKVAPRVAGPDAVKVGAPLAELTGGAAPSGEAPPRIDRAYLVSCTNSRLEDLRAAAAVLRGQRVAEHVQLYVAAASREIQERAEAEGVWEVLLRAGARPLPSGCGPCIGLGAGLLEPGEVGISASNRNFKGRMGSRDARCYLASPEVVARSAVEGRLAGPFHLEEEEGLTRLEPFAEAAVTEGAEVSIVEGFPAELEGRLVLVPKDDLDTDGIYGKEYTYRDGTTREEMARVALANHEPSLAARLRDGDVLVGGENFGTGSSREQAVTCLQAAGVHLLVTASTSDTYLRNAYNNGFPVVECPPLVRHLRQRHAAELAQGARALIPGTSLRVDFRRGRIECDGEAFLFPPLSEVAQRLVAAGGVEAVIEQRLRTEPTAPKEPTAPQETSER